MRNLHPTVRVIVDGASRRWLRFDLSGLPVHEREWTLYKADGYPPQAKILKPLKSYGRRADFVRFCGFGTDNTFGRAMEHFTMSRANVAAFLRNIHKDHGIGHVSDGVFFRLVLPAGTKPAAIWRRD